MVLPVAFPLAPFLMRAGITALGAGASGEGIKSLQNINPDVAEQAFLRTIIGPISDIFNRTTDTPSGKVFAPTGEVIEPNQIPGIAPPEQQQGITGLPIPEQQQGITGLPIPETQDKLKGFEKPQDVDMKILYKVENDEPKFKYPTKEEIEKYINEENEFWIKNQERANERYPELSSKNLPKITEADKHFGAAAFSFQDFKNSKLIYMSPKEYLNLTQKFRPKEGEENLGSTMNVQNIENLLKEGKELANIPMLYVKKTGDNFVVTGQEGIHRAKAFNNLGYDKIPVVVEGSTRAHAKEIKDIFPTSIQSESGEVLLTKPEDFYSVIGKKPLFTTEQETTEQPVKPGSSVENLTEDQSVNLKGLVSRSVGQEKGMKAIREIYNDDNFLDILNPDQQKYINNLEYSYVGGVGDLGNPIIPHIFDNPMLEQNQEYMQDYQQKLANLLEKNLGKKFPVYRLMDKKTALAIVTGDLPDIKTLQEDPETGESVLKEYTFEGPFGKQTIPQEFMGFSLSPKEALAFRDFSFSGARGKKDEDFVLMEYTTIPTNAVMRGHEGEKEIVFRTVDSPLSSFELYDIKFTKEEDKRDVQLKKNKDFENLKKRFNK
jgi:hypothetical protein